jgi:glycosyltransferase involved in cell wall biosynthesis
MTEISVVVPTKDRLPYLKKAVPTYLEHDEVREVIIVVDGCKDETLAYARAASASDDRIRYVDNGKNMGLTYSRNRGIELARCDYVFTGEDDLELSPGFFKTLMAHMQETAADIISGRNIFRFEHETAEQATDRTNQLTGSAVDRRAIAVQTGMHGTEDQEQPLLPAPMLGKTSLFREIKFDQSYRGNAWREESDFQLSARERGYKLVFCPHAVSFNVMIENDRGGAHSWVGAKRTAWVVRNNWRFVRKHRHLLAQEFDMGNSYAYITKFAVKRAFMEMMLPRLIEAKRRLMGRARIGS